MKSLLIILAICALAAVSCGSGEMYKSYADEITYSDETGYDRHPTDVFYRFEIAYRAGKMSVKSYVENGKIDMQSLVGESGGACREVGYDKLDSEYSEGVPTILCDNFADAEINAAEDNSGCIKKTDSTRNRRYVAELTNKSREVIESLEFDYDVKTTCFDCDVGDESGSLRRKCVTYDTFDITLIVPFSEQADTFRIYEIDKDGKQKQRASAGVSQHRKQVVESEYLEAD